jgi:MFS family permease
MSHRISFNIANLLTGFYFFCFILLTPIFATQDLGLSLTETGIALTAFAAAVVITSPIWGAISDRIGRRKIFLVGGTILFAVSSFLLFYVESYEQLLFLRAFQGIGFAANPMLTALFSDRFGRSTGKRFGVYSAANSLGWGLGGIVAGVLADLTDVRTVFIFAAFVALANATIMLCFIPEKQKQIQDQSATKVPGRLYVLYGTLFIRQAAAISLWAIFPIYLGNFVSSLTAIGLISSSNMLVQPAFMLLVGRIAERFDKLNLVLLGIIGSVITFMVFAVAPYLEFIVLGQIMIAISWSFVFIGINLYIIESTSSRNRGKAFGFLQASFTTAAAIGPLIGGPLSDLTSIPDMILIVSGMMLFSLPFLFILKSLDRKHRARQINFSSDFAGSD